MTDNVTLHTVKLQRKMPQSPKTSLEKQIEYILKRVFRGQRLNWGWTVEQKERRKRRFWPPMDWHCVSRI